MRILSGIQPTGSLHIGNYFAMMRPCIELQAEGESYVFIADYHALTQLPDAAALKQESDDVALDFLACGLDPEKTVFYRQSDLPQVTELAWLLSCSTPMGLLERCTSYKDKIAQGLSPNHGLFAYPVLMAADILITNANVVPVGKDQKQHLEVTRDIAQRFNNRYGYVFVIPEPRIKDAVATVPGVDGQKMSKSYANTISIFGAEKALRKKVMGIVTDSTPMEDPKDPDTCTVFALYKLFATEKDAAAMAERYREGGMGYGHAKQELFDIYWEHFRPMRARREELASDPGHVAAVLEDGAKRARVVAAKTLASARTAVGLSAEV